MIYTLSMFNTGQVTLPKKWREQFNTNKFIARPSGNKLLLEPLEDDTPEQLLDENVEIFNKGDGIRFKKGLSGEGLDKFIEELEANV